MNSGLLVLNAITYGAEDDVIGFEKCLFEALSKHSLMKATSRIAHFGVFLESPYDLQTGLGTGKSLSEALTSSPIALFLISLCMQDLPISQRCWLSLYKKTLQVLTDLQDSEKSIEEKDRLWRKLFESALRRDDTRMAYEAILGMSKENERLENAGKE